MATLAALRNEIKQLSSNLKEMSSDLQVLKVGFAALDNKASAILDTIKNAAPVGTSGVLPPITPPRRGSDYNRSVSVAAFMREKIAIYNAEAHEGDAIYLEFDEEATDKQLNKQAIDSLEMLLHGKAEMAFGRMTWAQFQTSKPRRAKEIVETAARLKELEVFAQASGQWAIKMLIAQRMKSKARNSATAQEKKKVKTSEKNQRRREKSNGRSGQTEADANELDEVRQDEIERDEIRAVQKMELGNNGRNYHEGDELVELERICSDDELGEDCRENGLDEGSPEDEEGEVLEDEISAVMSKGIDKIKVRQDRVRAGIQSASAAEEQRGAEIRQRVGRKRPNPLQERQSRFKQPVSGHRSRPVKRAKSNDRKTVLHPNASKRTKK